MSTAEGLPAGYSEDKGINQLISLSVKGFAKGRQRRPLRKEKGEPANEKRRKGGSSSEFGGQ